MKIVNFNDFLPFKKIREKMEISDDYIPNFKSSQATIEAMRWEEIKTRGLDISIEELIVARDGTLEHEDFPGQKMIVYIRDYNSGYRNDSLPKFHISWCVTLKNMTESGKYNRYVVAQRDDGFFMLNKMHFGELVEKNIKAKLDICRNCLSKLDYSNFTKSSSQRKKEIVKTFKVKEFLNEYNTDIKITPDYDEANQPLNEYPQNWSEISNNYRKSKNWTCESCGKNFSFNKRGLHVHHINGNKFDTTTSNLKALCNNCHSNEPYHNHMR